MRACCRLREWPHDAYREHIVDLLQRSGAAPSEVAELRERLIEARKVRLAEQGHVNKHHTITATPLLHHTTSNAPASAPANTGRVSPQPSSPLQQVCRPWDVMLCWNDVERSDAQPPQKVTIAPSLTTHSRGESKSSSLDEHGECACALQCCIVAVDASVLVCRDDCGVLVSRALAISKHIQHRQPTPNQQRPSPVRLPT